MSEQSIPQPKSADGGGETAEALLADPQARVRGKPVSPTQLARWHREGYVPKPTRRGLGRGRGTVSIYPPGTREQLRALCAFLSKERDAEKVAWRMWWAGYSVPNTFARLWLKRGAQMWEEYVRALRDARTPEQIEYGLLPDAAYDDLEQAADVRLRRPFMRHLRTRVGRDNISLVFHVILQLASGLFTGFAGNSASDAGEKSERQLIAEAFGLDRLGKAGLVPANVDLISSLEKDVRSFGELIATARPGQLLEQASDHDVEQARDDLRTLVIPLQESCRMFEQELGRHAAAVLVDLNRAVEGMGPIDQALWVLLWLTLRSRGLGEWLDGWVQMTRLWDSIAPMLRMVVARAKRGELLSDADGLER